MHIGYIKLIWSTLHTPGKGALLTMQISFRGSNWSSGGWVLGVEGRPERMRLTLRRPEQSETDGLGRIWVLILGPLRRVGAGGGGVLGVRTDRSSEDKHTRLANMNINVPDTTIRTGNRHMRKLVLRRCLIVVGIHTLNKL